MLTMLTQMPAFISVNRSERLPTSAGEQLRQPERVEGRPPVPQWVASQVRPDLERAPQRLQATFGKAILCKVRSSSSHMPIPILDFRMKTTLNIDDRVMAELKREAARQGRTMSELVETALRLLLASRRKRGRIPALPKFRSGGALVDVADRDALYHAMEGR
jgi:Arc/MetJ family transcription regulator